jgi:membrane protein DedA with SNARE-associated domain
MEEKPKNSLMQYAGFAAQLAGVLLAAVFAGKWVDKHTGIGFPILIWLLPLLVLIVLLIKVVKDTSTKK